MMIERGLHVDHTTIYRYVHPNWRSRALPILKRQITRGASMTTSIKVKKVWMYLYRAEDPQVNALEFIISPHELRQSAKRFFSKALAAPQIGLISLTLTKQSLFPS